MRRSVKLWFSWLRGFAERGHSPTILVTKVDRLGRDTVDVSPTALLFESLGARIVFLAPHRINSQTALALWPKSSEAEPQTKIISTTDPLRQRQRGEWTRINTDKKRFANAAELDLATTSLKVQGL